MTHINIYEFIGIIIELWICGRQLHLDRYLVDGGHILLALADNTSALSWLRYATRTKRPPVRRLARFLTAFLASPFLALVLRVQGKHLPGLLNEGADLLSRFEKAPSWESAINQCSHLKHLRTCQLPPELLSILSTILGSEQTEAWCEEKMTELWTIAPPTFEDGCNRLQGSATSIVI